MLKQMIREASIMASEAEDRLDYATANFSNQQVEFLTALADILSNQERAFQARNAQKCAYEALENRLMGYDK